MKLVQKVRNPNDKPNLFACVATPLKNHVTITIQKQSECKKVRPIWKHQLMFVVPVHETKRYDIKAFEDLIYNNICSQHTPRLKDL